MSNNKIKLNENNLLSTPSEPKSIELNNINFSIINLTQDITTKQDTPRITQGQLVITNSKNNNLVHTENDVEVCNIKVQDKNTESKQNSKDSCCSIW